MGKLYAAERDGLRDGIHPPRDRSAAVVGIELFQLPRAERTLTGEPPSEPVGSLVARQEASPLGGLARPLKTPSWPLLRPALGV